MHRALAVILPLAALIAGAEPAKAATFKVLHAFCATDTCDDGAQPLDGLIFDAAGHLFGVTLSGGQNGHTQQGGTVFEMIPKADGTWAEKVIHAFCAKPGCEDGEAPGGSLIADVAGNLYGTTISGGNDQQGGVVFRLTPNATRKNWKYKVLYRFCSVGGSDCTDGAFPEGKLAYQGSSSGAPYDGTSPLYGVTDREITSGGMIFALTPGAGDTWSETVVHSFCSKKAENCVGGREPVGVLLVDASANIFGTTYTGGAHHGGVAFELTRGEGGAWSETVLYDFCAQADCADGKTPGKLIMDATGALFGTAGGGGLSHDGVLFKLTPGAGQYTESVLYDFCALSDCADGRFPGGLSMDASGALFGETVTGGTYGHGNLFKYDGTYQVLYDFRHGGKLGRFPSSGTITDSSGNRFGELVYGGGGHYHGENLAGVVYELSP